MRSRVVIMGAAGRDFHNFNLVFRDDPNAEVRAFTAAQIPDIAGRSYPAVLAGPLYPSGIPIYPEAALPNVIREQRIDWVYLAYSDLAHVDVMHKASIVLACGANFGLLGPEQTMLRASVPVIAVCAVRTGVGKSPLSQHIVRWLREQGHRVVAIRHPMPYGDLAAQAVQRFASFSELDAARVTIEEREEYEPYVRMGAIVFAGVDYAAILAQAQEEADVVLWDGGNNDFPFIKPDLHFTLLDAHRPGHELSYHPGEVNFRMADVLIINKVDSAPQEQVDMIIANAQRVCPETPLLLGELTVSVDDPSLIGGKRVVIVEDGPTLTHGGMDIGAGSIAARRFGAKEIVDARPYAVGAIGEAFRDFAHLSGEIPAMGYSPQQVRELEATLRSVPADSVIDATPVDLSRLIAIDKPIADVSYTFRERGDRLDGILRDFESRFIKREPRGMPRGLQ